MRHRDVHDLVRECSEAPRMPREDERLAQAAVRDAMARVLGTAAEAICCERSDFFALGGDSLSALRLLMQIRPLVDVGVEQRIPVTAPDDFDHVPACTSEGGFQFLNDLAITTNRSIQSLEVAINDPREVVQFFAGRESQSAE